MLRTQKMGLQANYVCLIYSELQGRSLETMQNEMQREKNIENSENSKRAREPDKRTQLARLICIPAEKRENYAETILK